MPPFRTRARLTAASHASASPAPSGLALGAALCALLLTGCGPNAFVDARLEDGRDPRENLLLTGVDARISSGAMELRRIRGTTATLDDAAGLLTLHDVRVDMLDTSGSPQSITRAGTATAFLKDQAPGAPAQGGIATATSDSLPHRRNDFVFDRGVFHRSLGPDAGERLRLETERLLWDQTAGFFRAPGKFRVQAISVSAATGAPSSSTMHILGSAFVATARMDRWSVLGGAFTSGGDRPPSHEDISAERRRLLNDLRNIPDPPRDHFQTPEPLAPPPDGAAPQDDPTTSPR